MRNEEIYQEQKKRQAKFPKDRICYCRLPTSAMEDQRSMRSFARGEITLKTLCIQLAWNNYLDYVSEEQAWKALRESGYVYDNE